MGQEKGLRAGGPPAAPGTVRDGRTLGNQKRARLGAVDLRTGRALAWNPKWNTGLQWTAMTIAAAGGRVFVGAAVTAGGNTPPCAIRTGARRP